MYIYINTYICIHIYLYINTYIYHMYIYINIHMIMYDYVCVYCMDPNHHGAQPAFCGSGHENFRPQHAH